MDSVIKRWPIAFGPTVVPPGQSVIIEASAGTRFKPEKLILTGDAVHRAGLRKWLFKLWSRFLARTGIAATESPGNCYITMLLVGSQHQLPVTNPISTLCFSPGILENEMVFDSTLPHERIAIQVQNLSKRPRMVSFTMFGKAERVSKAERESWLTRGATDKAADALLALGLGELANRGAEPGVTPAPVPAVESQIAVAPNA